MSKIVWATDVHLDFLSPSDDAYQRWIAAIRDVKPTGVLLTGDIATAPTLETWLKQLGDDLHLPLYFVLGNHDYYHGSIHTVRRFLTNHAHPSQFWLGSGITVPLSEQTTLIGHSGWGDTRIGDFMETPIRINDHRLIAELSGLNRSILQNKLLDLGTEAANTLNTALQQCQTQRVIIATHVPPFRSSTWYNGRYGDIEWMPDFCCGATGEVLLKHARANPQQHFIVYCGHTHGEGRYTPLPNLDIFTGKADYGTPDIQGLIDINSGIVIDAARYLTAS